MPHYISVGQIPHKRHTQFRNPKGDLYSEELFSTEGFRPHPGAVAKSIGKRETNELAVMDTFHPLLLTMQALNIENEGYAMSWSE